MSDREDPGLRCQACDVTLDLVGVLARRGRETILVCCACWKTLPPQEEEEPVNSGSAGGSGPGPG